MTDTRPQIFIVYSWSSSESYRELARRLFTALKERSREATLTSTRELCETVTDLSHNAILAVVDPVECAATSNDRSKFFAKLNSAGKRIAISVEAVEDARYSQHLRLSVDFDAIFDVGFVSQSAKHPNGDVPYYFVFNGPTKWEEQTIAELPLSRERPIPWAVVGHQTPEHLRVVAELIDHKRYPGGFVFLQPLIRMRKRGSPLSSSELAAVLSQSRFHLWSAQRSSAHYESSRFIEALLAGAVPCKIDGNRSWENSDVPGIFPSVRAFCKGVEEDGYQSMYRSAREFYVSSGRLVEHLEGALRLV